MFVEKLNEIEINDLAFKVLVSLAHKNKNNYTLKEVSMITKVKDLLYFEILCYEGPQNTLTCIHVNATDNGVYVDDQYNLEASMHLGKLIKKRINLYETSLKNNEFNI